MYKQQCLFMFDVQKISVRIFSKTELIRGKNKKNQNGGQKFQNFFFQKTLVTARFIALLSIYICMLTLFK